MKYHLWDALGRFMTIYIITISALGFYSNNKIIDYGFGILGIIACFIDTATNEEASK